MLCDAIGGPLGFLLSGGQVAALPTPNHSLMTFACPLRGGILASFTAACSLIRAMKLESYAATATAIGCNRSVWDYEA